MIHSFRLRQFLLLKTTLSCRLGQLISEPPETLMDRPVM